MGLRFDIQKEMLEYLRDHYGRANRFDDRFRSSEGFVINAQYLREHEMIKGTFPGSVNPRAKIVNVSISAKGLDLLEPSGGLTALLNTRTIRFDEETLLQVMQIAIEAMDASQETKQTLVAKVRTIPIETLKAGVLKLMERGAEKGLDLLKGILLGES